MKYFFLFLSCFLGVNTFSQEITGVVLDQKTMQPIESVAVYFDNTTKGVITNEKGVFTIDYIQDANTPLVVSFLGYKKIILEEYLPNKHYKFLLEEDENTLEEVVLVSKDTWSRAYKLKLFKNEFLGQTKNGKSCVILNEEDIQLHFYKNTKKLIAKASKPIIIINKKLNYRLQYDLQDFEIAFQTNHFKNKEDITYKESLSKKSVYYSGTTFFSDLNKTIDAKVIKARNKAYYGSVMHFMRAIAKNQLKEEGFKIINGGYIVEPQHYIITNPLEDASFVKARFTKRISIVYKRKQSFVEPIGDTSDFVIDLLGNYSPVQSIQFGGEMGVNRIGGTLPLDFNLEK